MNFIATHFWLIAAAILSLIVLAIAWVLRERPPVADDEPDPLDAHKAAPLPATPKERARAFLPWAIALCAGLAIWALWPGDARSAAPIGPAPVPHPSCGEAPLLILNEDTGELFPAVGATLEPTPINGVPLLRFRDGRVFCNGYEGATP